MQMQGAVFFLLFNSVSLVPVNSVSLAQTNTKRWQTTTKTKAPEIKQKKTQQKLYAYNTLTMAELSPSLPHAYYHLKSFLSSKPSQS